MKTALFIFLMFIFQTVLTKSVQSKSFCLTPVDAKKIATYVLKDWHKKNAYGIMILNENEKMILAKAENSRGSQVGTLIRVLFKQEKKKTIVSVSLDKLKHGRWLWGNFSYDKFISAYENLYDKWPSKSCSK